VEWLVVSRQLSERDSLVARQKLGCGKNLENAGKMNFFLMSRVEFLGKFVVLSCEGGRRGLVFAGIARFF
jgi:hypothetical protein